MTLKHKFLIYLYHSKVLTYLFAEKKIKTKKEKKQKVSDPEEHTVGVFNLKECKADKKDKKPKLSVLLDVSGNSKQTAINGDVS